MGVRKAMTGKTRMAGVASLSNPQRRQQLRTERRQRQRSVQGSSEVAATASCSGSMSNQGHPIRPTRLMMPRLRAICRLWPPPRPRPNWAILVWAAQGAIRLKAREERQMD